MHYLHPRRCEKQHTFDIVPCIYDQYTQCLISYFAYKAYVPIISRHFYHHSKVEQAGGKAAMFAQVNWKETLTILCCHFFDILP